MAGSLNLYQKLAKARKTVEVLEKNARGYGYTYVSEDEILAKLTVAMDKYGLFLIPEIVPGTFDITDYRYSKTKTTKSGEVFEEHVNELIAKADMTFIWVDIDNPDDRLQVPWAMVGHQSDGSQGFGTALSYAYRYFLLKFFGVATVSDDPDAWRSKQKATEQEEERAVVAALVSQIDSAVKAYIGEDEARKKPVKTFLSKYVKDGNYFSLKTADDAGKLYKDFKEKFGIQ